MIDWRLAAVGTALIAGCVAPAGGGSYRGTELPRALARPAFTLAATTGQPFSFQSATAGRLTFLFFGYTHCPDVCPVQMANLAAALLRLSPSERRRIAVVFVTTDPARDSLPRLRQWLDAFDSSFVGLRGDDSTVARIEATLALPGAVREPVTDTVTGNYGVGHAAQVLAFSPDDSAHLAFPFGTRQADWAHDLPLLLYGRWDGR
ncbi:MAG: SCO family protein [Gemmatimonadales bacterium]